MAVIWRKWLPYMVTTIHRFDSTLVLAMTAAINKKNYHYHYSVNWVGACITRANIKLATEYVIQNTTTSIISSQN